ncbi:hypothetical protein [Isoptericola sp. BMS4]|uniref:hypothetical protein n=1 Tax=Isoptericola sp. BMS4 TaxID=2527875 RepID=UPI0014210E6F|nr:hypothetical protein [Isoptericola sp. BMS4]
MNHARSDTHLRRALVVAVAAVAALAGCTGAEGSPTVEQPTEAGGGMPSATATDPGSGDARTDDTSDDTSDEELCATLPAAIAGPYEGWFNGTPALPDGSVVTETEDFPDVIREHPRVVLVNTWSGEVVASYDRVRCGRVDGWEAPDEASSWPEHSVVVVDATTGDVVEHFRVDREGAAS